MSTESPPLAPDVRVVRLARGDILLTMADRPWSDEQIHQFREAWKRSVEDQLGFKVPLFVVEKLDPLVLRKRRPVPEFFRQLLRTLEVGLRRLEFRIRPPVSTRMGVPVTGLWFRTRGVENRISGGLPRIEVLAEFAGAWRLVWSFPWIHWGDCNGDTSLIIEPSELLRRGPDGETIHHREGLHGTPRT